MLPEKTNKAHKQFAFGSGMAADTLFPCALTSSSTGPFLHTHTRTHAQAWAQTHMAWSPDTGLFILTLAWHLLGTLLLVIVTHDPTLPTYPDTPHN